MSPFSFRSILLALGFIMALLPFGSFGITFVVRNTNDAGSGSLRQAVIDSGALGGGHTILFSNIVAGTITFASGEMVISNDVTIMGPGSPVLALSGNTNNRMFNIGGTNAHVKITGLTFTKGTTAAGDRGGCIHNLGILNVSDCIFSNNVSAGTYGAVFFNRRFLTISNSIICSNLCGSASGGGLFNEGTAEVVNSTLYGNNGGQGGALNNQSGGILLVTNCTICINTANGGGAGIFTAGVLYARHCTIVSNLAIGIGLNRGGGVWNLGTVANIGSTIIANNTTFTNTGPDCFGSFTSAGYNLIGKADGSTGWTGLGDQAGTIASPLPPSLGPFEFNGGFTRTIVPLPGSLALDQGKAFTASDQRGRSRPVDFSSIINATAGDGSDIGAVEVWPDSPALNIARNLSSVVVSWPVSASDFRLQSVTNVMALPVWTAVTSTPVMAGGRYFVTNSNPDKARFYRLIFP